MPAAGSLALALVLGLVVPLAVAAADDRAEITTVDRDDPLVGRIAGVDPGGTLHVTLDSGEAVTLAGSAIVTVTFPGSKATPGPVRLELVGGDILCGTIQEESDSAIVLAGAAFERIVVPLERVRVLELPAALDGLKERPLLAPAEGRDVVFRRLENNVDRVTGTIGRIGPGSITLETSLGDLAFGFDRIVAVAFSSPDRARAPEGLHTVALTADGCRLTGVLEGLRADRLVLETPHGFTVPLAVAHLKALLFKGGSFDFLSDLDPVEVEERSFFPGVVWNWRRDRTTTGNPLRMSGVEYPKGLGVHAYCALTYALDGRYRRLRGRIGIDDEVKSLRARGAVVFLVLVDGKEVYRSPLVRGLEPPLKLPEPDLTDAKRLTLIVDFGDDSHAGDRADWAMPILVRKRS